MRKLHNKTYKSGYSLIGEPLLNKRIQIFHKELVKNALNEYEEQFILLKEKYALIIPQTGSLLKDNGSETILTNTTHKFIVRFDQEIKNDMQILYKNEKYNIKYVLNPYNDNTYLEIFTEVVI